ncbi:alpha/beta fold hydrolase [Pirellulaceae bacterium SH467]
MSHSDWRSEYPFVSRWLTLSDRMRMHYVDEGPTAKGNATETAATILAVHGNPTWSFYYRSIVSRFRESARVLAVDHIGCGWSDKPQDYPYTLAQHTSNLVQFLDRLDLRDLILVVHDWGGAIGLGAAVQRPDRFAKILILNTAAFPPPYIPLRIAACRWPWIGTAAMRYGNLFARAALWMAIDRLPRLSPTARDGLLAPYNSYKNRVAIDRFVHDIPMHPSHPTYAVLEKLEQDLSVLASKPIHFLWGMKDWCFVPPCMERLQRSFPNATRTELSDVGHYVMEEAPDEVEGALRQLLAK